MELLARGQHPLATPGRTYLIRMFKNEIARALAKSYADIPDVEAVSIAGSAASGMSDEQSDVDLYIYSHTSVPLPIRKEITKARANQYEVGNELWEPHDAWFERSSGKAVEVVFRTTLMIEDNFNKILKECKASLGYSTGIWHSIKSSQLLFDRNGWYDSIQKLAAGPYPEPLRQAIVSQKSNRNAWLAGCVLRSSD